MVATILNLLFHSGERRSGNVEMSKRQVRFSDNVEEDLGKPKTQRLEEDNSIDSDEEENSNERKAKPNENVLTEDDIEGSNNFQFNSENAQILSLV